MGINHFSYKGIQQRVLNLYSTNDLVKLQPNMNPATKIVIQEILDSRSDYRPEVKGNLTAGLTSWPWCDLKHAETELKRVKNMPALALVQAEINRRLVDGLQNNTAA